MTNVGDGGTPSQLRRVLIATQNVGKANEFRAFLSPLGVEVMMLSDVGRPLRVEPEEVGSTFEEIACAKAQAIAQQIELPVLADDSGLCVDALEGAPGLRSARYAGEGATDQDNCRTLLEQLRQKKIHPQPREGMGVWSEAYFVCALALYVPSIQGTHRGWKRWTVVGTCHGWIIDTPIGNSGFGYDPLFYVPEYRCTFAQMPREQKTSYSHRGQALRHLVERLRHGLNDESDAFVRQP